jgi:hypothetical protein
VLRRYAQVSDELLLCPFDFAEFPQDLIEHLSDVLVRRLRGCRHPGHLLSLSLNKNRTRPVATSRRTPNQRHAYVRYGRVVKIVRPVGCQPKKTV